MNNKKCGVMVLCLMFILLMALSGCSSKGSSGSSDQVEIKLGYYSSPTSDAKMKELVEAFTKKHPHIKIVTETAPYNQFVQKLDTQIAGGNAPDVWLSDGVLVSKFAERGAIKDVTSLIEKDLNKDDFYGFDYNKDPKGQYWGVPQGIQVGALFYNKDMFDKAKVSYPTAHWTWDDTLKAAEKVTMDTSGKYADESGFKSKSIKQYGLTFFNITEGWFPVMKAYGGGVLDESMKKSIVNSKENKEAVQWMVDGMKKNVITDPADIKSFKNPVDVFPSQAAAMRIGLYARTLAANEAGLNYDVTLLPTGPNGKRFAPVIANSWVINKKADDQKTTAAWEWIKYWVTNDDVQKQWGDLGEAIPVKKSVANSDAFLKGKINKKVFIDSLEFAGTLDANAVWTEWLAKFNDNINPAFTGEESIDESLQKADKDIQSVLDSFYKK